MQKNSRTLISALIIAILLVTGCRAKELSTPAPASLVSIAISPLSPSMAPGTTLQLRATGTYSNNIKTNLTSSATWNSSNTAIATVDAQGLVSAALSATGTTNISASFGGLSATTILTNSDLATIAVTPTDQTIASGTTIQYTATGTLANTATQNISNFVIWGSNLPGTADISSSGLATAGSTPGTAMISATFTTGMSTTTGSTSLTSADVASIAIAPSDSAITLGTTQQYTATGTLAVSGSLTQNLTSWATWTSSSPSVATISNTVGTKGLAISAATGTTFIRATYSLATSNTATLVVKPATLQSISVTPASASVALGLTQQFTATGTYSDSTTQDLTSDAAWFSSNTLVSAVSNTVGLKGLATTLATGSAAISAQFSGITSNSAVLTVTAPELVSITVLPPNPSIKIGFTQQFQAIGLFTDNSIQDLTTTVTWSSSFPGIAFITNATGFQGLATAQGQGSTTIEATLGSISGSTVLTVPPF